MSRWLGPLALLALVLALGAAGAKIRLDRAAIAAARLAEPGIPPPPQAPAGLDGRPLDPNIAVQPAPGQPLRPPGPPVRP